MGATACAGDVGLITLGQSVAKDANARYLVSMVHTYLK